MTTELEGILLLSLHKLEDITKMKLNLMRLIAQPKYICRGLSMAGLMCFPNQL